LSYLYSLEIKSKRVVLFVSNYKLLWEEKQIVSKIKSCFTIKKKKWSINDIFLIISLTICGCLFNSWKNCSQEHCRAYKYGSTFVKKLKINSIKHWTVIIFLKALNWWLDALRTISRVVFIACYGLGFWLLSFQATWAFLYFRRLLEASRSLEGRCLKASAPRSQEPPLRAPQPF
jgi:hypothetical protein